MAKRRVSSASASSRQDLAHALRARPFGVVVVRREHRLAHELLLALAFVARAQRVVEDDDARRARDFPSQALDLGVVHRLELLRVEEILHRGRCSTNAKPFPSSGARRGAAVADGHGFARMRPQRRDVARAEVSLTSLPRVDGVGDVGRDLGRRGDGESSCGCSGGRCRVSRDTVGPKSTGHVRQAQGERPPRGERPGAEPVLATMPCSRMRAHWFWGPTVR